MDQRIKQVKGKGVIRPGVEIVRIERADIGRQRYALIGGQTGAAPRCGECDQAGRGQGSCWFTHQTWHTGFSVSWTMVLERDFIRPALMLRTVRVL